MRKILYLLILLMLATTACRQQKPDNTAPAENEQLVKQYFDYFNKHQWTEMAAMYADTAEFKDPSLGQGIVKQTRQQTIDKYTELSKAFPDIKDKVINLYPSGDAHIIVEFVSSGTGADKSAFELLICSILKFEKGKIVQDFTYYDNF